MGLAEDFRDAVNEKRLLDVCDVRLVHAEFEVGEQAEDELFEVHGPRSNGWYMVRPHRRWGDGEQPLGTGATATDAIRACWMKCVRLWKNRPAAP